MLIGSIYGWENGGDDIFDLNSFRNRDNCLEPFRAINQRAFQNGVEIHTSDVNESNQVIPDFSLYVESVDFVPCGAKKHYLILYETPLTVPKNAHFSYLNQFDFIFTWSKELIKNGFQSGCGDSISSHRFIQFQHPNPIPKECSNTFHSPSFEARLDFVCLIGSNRHANSFDKRELYSERVSAIKWFESHALDNFKLYGGGWRVPQKRFGSLGKLRYRTQKIISWLTGTPSFPSYQGFVGRKYDVLSRTKFCICFENARDLPGYITEKLFDCFFAGCVPIYLGDAEIAQVVPPNCFIDFRKFQSYEELYKYLHSISPKKYFQYQQDIRNFLMSEQFLPFRSENFADVIIQKIVKDFRENFSCS
jgi:alpha(1,3/1,4) fucosyltransferase